VLVRRKENLRKLLLISEVLLMRISPLVFFKIGFCLLLQSGTSVAHHAFSAEFDQTKPVMLRGTVTRMEWINPHSWLHIDVRQEDGTVESWMIEAGPAGVLVRRGWTRESVAVGTDVLVEGYQARDGSNRANGRDVTLPDGQRLFAGSGGLGAAPQDGGQLE
jgi:hypothetical protein